MEKEDLKREIRDHGRLIRDIKNDIERLKSNPNDDTSIIIEKLKIRLKEELKKHKELLNKRYKDEFLKSKMGIFSFITKLPKAIGIQIEKVANSIEELKQAKENEETIKHFEEVLKDSGLLIATPVIFMGKYAVDNWYLIILLALLSNKFGLLNNHSSDNININNVIQEEPVLVSEAEKEQIMENLKEKYPAHLPRALEVGRALNLENGIDPSSFGNNLPERIREIIDTPLFRNYMESIRNTKNTIDMNSIYEALKSCIPNISNMGVDVFNSYEDALNYVVNEMGYTTDSAKKLLESGDLSIRWLTGKNGMFNQDIIDKLRSFSPEELKSLVEANKETIESIEESREMFENDFLGFLKTLSASEVLIYLSYQIINNAPNLVPAIL
ncbi:MAG: hypothetical protein IJ568_01755 [Bacilli bacterium]|nr:hypothetical protein [Bacilli bacterium]